MNFKQVVFETPRTRQSWGPLWRGAAWRSRSGRQPHGLCGHLRGPGGDLGKCRVRRRSQRNGDGVVVKSGVENQVDVVWGLGNFVPFKKDGMTHLSWLMLLEIVVGSTSPKKLRSRSGSYALKLFLLFLDPGSIERGGKGGRLQQGLRCPLARWNCRGMGRFRVGWLLSCSGGVVIVVQIEALMNEWTLVWIFGDYVGCVPDYTGSCRLTKLFLRGMCSLSNQALMFFKYQWGWRDRCCREVANSAENLKE